jgi:hypothetical protein
MFALFACSLALAAGLSRVVDDHRKQAGAHERLELPGLGLTPPRGWNLSQIEKDHSGQTQRVVLAEANRSGRTIEIAVEESRWLRSPSAALRQSLQSAVPDQDDVERGAVLPVRGGFFVGNASVATRNVQGTLQTITAAAWTTDGRTYWTTRLTDPRPHNTSRGLEDARADIDLLKKLAASAGRVTYDSRLRMPWQFAGLPMVAMPSTLEDITTETDQAMILRPRDKQSWLRLIRVVGCVDPGVTDNGNDLSPAAMMNQVSMMTAGDSQPTPVVESLVANCPVWHTEPKDPNQKDAMSTLRRRLGIVRVPGGRLVTFELIWDTDPMGTVAKLLEETIKAMAAASANQPVDSHKRVTQMIMDGRRIAEAHRAGWANGIASGRTIQVLSGDRGAFGARVTDVIPSTGTQSLSRQGSWEMWTSAQERSPRISGQWIASTDGFAFTSKMLRPRSIMTAIGGGSPSVTGTEILALDSGVLTQSLRAGSAERVLWRVPQPAAHICPIADEWWPIDALNEITVVRADTELAAPPSRSAIVWLSRDRWPPMPHLIEFTPWPDTPDYSGELRLRPIGSVDFDRIVLDNHGRLKTGSWVVSSGTITAEVTDAQTIVAALPWMEPKLMQHDKGVTHE